MHFFAARSLTVSAPLGFLIALLAAQVACGGSGASTTGSGGAPTTGSASSTGGASNTSSSSSSSTGGGGTGGGGPTAGTGSVGDACSPPGAIVCAGHAQSDRLVCGPDMKWQANDTCPAGKLCDSAKGECAKVVIPCAGKQPNDVVCDQNHRIQCGPDLVTSADLEACMFVCAGGQCSGACAPGATQCSGNTPETCDASGQWQSGAPCQYVCGAGACGGACVPGSQQCSGSTVQTCSASGQWQNGAPCPFICSASACAGSCVPGTKQCNGNTPQTCDANGQWQDGVSCQFVCSAGACAGSCTPGDKQCSGSQAQACTPQGQWQTTASCQYVCASGQCTGVCTPGATQCLGAIPQVCDANGQWQSGAACPFVCSGGSCTGMCAPGATQCNGNTPQTCDATGQWQSGAACPFVCSGGSCGGVCAPGMVQCSGNTAQTCDASGQWQNGSTCAFGCSAGACLPDPCAGVSCATAPAPTCANASTLRTYNASGTCQGGNCSYPYTDTSCPYGCQAGACLPNPCTQCTLGQTSCSGNSVKHCVNVNGCLTWDAGTACPTGATCSGGACVEPPTTLTTSTQLCGVHRYSGAFNVVGGAAVTCPTGDLTIYATSILVDPASSISMSSASTNFLPDPQYCTSASQGCYGPTTSYHPRAPGGGGYGTPGTAGGNGNWEVDKCVSQTILFDRCDTCTGQLGGPATGSPFDIFVTMGQGGGAYTTTKGGAGGGALRLISSGLLTVQGNLGAPGQAGQADPGTFPSNFHSGGGSGGGILLAAPSMSLSGSSTISTPGGVGGNAMPLGSGTCSFPMAAPGSGGNGRVKIVYGDSYANTATVAGATISASYLPPLDFTSTTHPDPTLFYNDNFGSFAVSWAKPYNAAAGYWYAISSVPNLQLTPSNGTFTTGTSASIPAAQMTGAGPFYFYVLTLDGTSAQASTMANRFTINVNSAVHTIASSTHPDENAWYSGPSSLSTAAFSWTPPAGVPAASFVGYWYRIDHVSDSTFDPASPAGWTFTTNSSVITTTDSGGAPFANGTYYFHLVSSDTAGNPTKYAAHYRLQLGPQPAMMSFFGYVSSTSAVKIQGATVKMQPYGLTTTTDVNGYFIFSNVYQGSYTLTAQKTGYTDTVVNVTVSPANVPYNVTLGP